jgi:hypothetical protein
MGKTFASPREPAARDMLAALRALTTAAWAGDWAARCQLEVTLYSLNTK